MDTDAADAAELEEREDEVVVARVEREARLLDDPPGLLEVVVRLLDGRDRRDPGELGDRLRLDVDDDAAGDVVDDDRPVACGGDRLEVLDDPPLRRLVVGRAADEQRVRAGFGEPLALRGGPAVRPNSE